jgi:hypothetical protein
MKRTGRSSNISNLVDSGIKEFDRYSVANVEFSEVASDLVKACVEECNDRRKDELITPHELVLADDVDLVDAILWMGKAVARDYGPDFVLIEASKSSASNRAADLAAARLAWLKKDGSLGFAFFVERDDLPDISQHERAERLRENLGSLAVPTMNILTTMTVEAEGFERAIDSATIIPVTPRFTIDTQLEYPLILRRTAELS